VRFICLSEYAFDGEHVAQSVQFGERLPDTAVFHLSPPEVSKYPRRIVSRFIPSVTTVRSPGPRRSCAATRRYPPVTHALLAPPDITA
jgi:hypothetical protein